MIVKTEVMSLLVGACPSFASQWAAYIESEYAPGEERLLYVDLGQFARHLVGLYERRQISEFDGVFDAVESLLVEGDAYVREAATIGLLEGIQNTAPNRVDPEAFVRFLRPESERWWKELNAFWDGKRRYVGEGIHNDT